MLYIFALMTALQWEIEVKDTGEMIPAVPLAESCSALRGLAEHVRGLEASVALGSLHRCLCWLSWSRTEEINELAKMLSLCLVHVREPSPSWTCCPWAWEFEQPLASSSQPRETVGESGRFPETTSCKRRPEAAFSYAIPSKSAGFGLGFYLDQGLNSLSGDGQGRSEVLELPGWFAADQAELWQYPRDFPTASAPNHLTSAVTDCKNQTKKGTSLL